MARRRPHPQLAMEIEKLNSLVMEYDHRVLRLETLERNGYGGARRAHCTAEQLALNHQVGRIADQWWKIQGLRSRPRGK